ncbi:MAG: SRPBCC family protein [Candidatus Omnitrophica bacterium]|nr:SRPBCC family protein [Candidatus Omnitrophota bacterium]
MAMNPTLSKTKASELIQLRIERFIPAKPWRVLRMIAKVEDFPLFMPNVKKTQVIQRSRHGAVTHWFVEVEGLPIQWKERDTFDLANFTIHFELIEGDLEEFKGSWRLQRVGEGTEVTVDVTARLGIPIVEKVVADILQEKLTRNFQLILEGMENRFLTERYRHAPPRSLVKPTGFVVMGHPYNFNHLVRIFRFFKPDLRCVTQDFILKLFELTPSYHSYDIPEFRSATGKSIHGYFVMCPIIPDMIDASPERVFQKVVEGCRIGERLGAGIVALGGFTSIVGERFSEKLRTMIKIPLTTGNTFTAAMAVEGVRKASHLMGIDIGKATVTIIGGTGDIGSACAKVLAREVKGIIITGRNKENLNHWKSKLQKEGRAKIEVSTDNNKSVRRAEIVIACASSSKSLVDIKSFKPGTVICDVAYPKNTSYMTAYRNDIFCFSGGLCAVPSPFDLGFDIGLPTKNILYGCFAEAIMLSLEDKYVDFSRGKGYITPEKIEEIKTIGEKHGFKLAPFYWGDRLVSERDILSIRSNVRDR